MLDKEVHEVRFANWKRGLQCQDRHNRTTQKEWLVQNEIPEAKFYYWLRKIRQEAFSEIDLTKCKTVLRYLHLLRQPR